MFCNKKRDIDSICMQIQSKGEWIGKMHGDISQEKREKTLKLFKDGKIRILLASDVMKRGIDVTDIQVVIQVDPSTSVEDYIHRAGRTARAGREGTCITLFDPEQAFQKRKIESIAGIRFNPLYLNGSN